MAKSVNAPSSSKSPKAISYSYVALSNQNKPVKGTIKAANEIAAEQLLTRKGLKTLSLEARASQWNMEQMLPALFSVKPQEAINFSRQLATLLESGITLLPCLEIMHQQVHNRTFKKILTTVTDDLRTGTSFSNALAKHPKVFNEIYCKTIAAGERTGKLETILRQMADYQENQIGAKKKITGALRYPMIIITMAILVSIILMLTALPQLTNLFQQMEMELPLPTRILIWIHGFVSSYKLYLLVGVLLIAALAIWVRKQPQARLWLDRRLLSAPLIGPPMHASEIGRFSRTASVLLGAGLPLQEVMETVPPTSSNLAMRHSLTKVNQDLIRGEGVYGPMSRDDIFPPLLTQMVLVGEESNTLASTLSVVADFYENDTAEKIDSMVGIIQPASTIFIALVVAFIAVAIMMPMYSMTQYLDK